MTDYVYRLFDNDDTLLYIGASKTPQGRLVAHARKPWGSAIDHMTEKAYPTRGLAEAAEQEAIASEQPRHNYLYHPNPGPRLARNLNYRIPDDLHRALKILCAQEGITLKTLIERMLRAAVDAGFPA